jgi:hypothetical protein
MEYSWVYNGISYWSIYVLKSISKPYGSGTCGKHKFEIPISWWVYKGTSYLNGWLGGTPMDWKPPYQNHYTKITHIFWKTFILETWELWRLGEKQLGHPIMHRIMNNRCFHQKMWDSNFSNSHLMVLYNYIIIPFLPLWWPFFEVSLLRLDHISCCGWIRVSKPFFAFHRCQEIDWWAWRPTQPDGD